MHSSAYSYSWTWQRVRQQLEMHPTGTWLRYPKDALPHPRQAGARISAGLPVGQQADYRFDAEPDCRGMHVHEHESCWVAHLDQVHPDCGPIEHVIHDAPGVWCAGGAAIGAVLGAALTKDAAGAVAGAGIGLLAALAVAPVKVFDGKCPDHGLQTVPLMGAVPSRIRCPVYGCQDALQGVRLVGGAGYDHRGRALVVNADEH